MVFRMRHHDCGGNSHSSMTQKKNWFGPIFIFNVDIVWFTHSHTFFVLHQASIRDGDGNTALHLACMNNDIKTVEAILNAITPAELKEFQQTAAHQLAQSNTSCRQFSIDLDQRNFYGKWNCNKIFYLFIFLDLVITNRCYRSSSASARAIKSFDVSRTLVKKQRKTSRNYSIELPSIFPATTRRSFFYFLDWHCPPLPPSLSRPVRFHSIRFRCVSTFNIAYVVKRV